MLNEKQVKYLKDNSLKINLDIDYSGEGRCYIDIYNQECSVYASSSQIDEIETEIVRMVDFLIDYDEGDVDAMSEDELHYQDLDEYFNYQGGNIDEEVCL